MKGSPLAFLVLVRARIGQVCAGHGSKVVEGRKLYKLKSGISVHLYLSLSNFVTLSLSLSLSVSASSFGCAFVCVCRLPF